MPRAHKLRALSLAAVVTLSACNSGQSREELLGRIAELEDENASLRQQLDVAQSEANEASSAADDAHAAAQAVVDEADRFAFEDWQNVVADVQGAAERAAFAAEDAAAQAGEAEDAATY